MMLISANFSVLLECVFYKKRKVQTYNLVTFPFSLASSKAFSNTGSLLLRKSCKLSLT